MIIPYALRVLGVLGEAAPGDMVAARRAAYLRVPRALRSIVRGRVARAVSEAIFTTNAGDDESHVHRLAYLSLLRMDVPSPDDVGEVRTLFEAARARGRAHERPSTFRTLALGVCMLLVPAALFAWWTWPRDSFAILTDELPESTDAYVAGGRPSRGTAAQREVFAAMLPTFVVELDRERAERADRGGRDAELTRAANEVVAACRDAFGVEITSYLQAVVDQSIAIVKSADEALGAAAESHIRSVDALNASLQAAGLGYYVDAEVATHERTHARRIYLSTFAVEHVSVYRSGETTVRALRLRRLDSLNFARAVLGFTRPHIRDALVLEEPIDEHLIHMLLPALVDGAPLILVGDRDPEGRALGEAVAHTAGAALRSEVQALIGDDGSAGAELGSLFIRRAALFDTVGDRLEPSGIRIIAPRGYAFSVERYRPLEPHFMPAEWRELRTLERALSEPQNQRAFATLRGHLRASVERHEVQHRLDFLSGTVAEAPPALAQLTRAARPCAELSAYLSEIARQPELARTNLALIAQHLLDRTHWGRAESYAALVIVGAIADALQLPHDLRAPIDRGELTRILIALFETPGPVLSDAATRAWTELFQRPFPELTRSTAVDVWEDDVWNDADEE